MFQELNKGGLTFKSDRVQTKEDFLRELERNPPDLILSDYRMPKFDGLKALALAKNKAPDVPFIFVTGSLGEEMAISALRSGATDYVLKDKLSSLAPAVYRALAQREERRLRREAEEALRRSEERYRLLVETVEDYAIYMLDTEGRVATWNTGAERIEGYSADEIIGQSISVFFTWEDLQEGRPEKILKTAKEEGRCLDEGWRLRKDGSRFWSQVAITAVRDAGGRLSGFSKVARDVTERKQAEEQIRQLNSDLELRVVQRTEQLEAANNELEAFSYSISHDLRAPVRHIEGFVEMLQRTAASELSPDNRAVLKTIAKSAHHMNHLIDDLLTFSRMGRTEMLFTRLSLRQLFEHVRSDIGPELRERKIVWSIGRLPEIRGDPVTLRQVLVNLLSNAVKYTRHCPEARIEVGVLDAKNEIVVFVRDNGVGFDQQYANKLFGVFQRLHSSSEFEGTGIGLAIVRRIISRHRGRTWAEGVVNKGATFYFSLPKFAKP